MALFNRIPPSRFSRGKFSLGECARQSARARPMRSVSTPKIPRAAVAVGDFHRDTFGQILSQMCLCQFQNFIAFLLRNETEGQLRYRVTGNHSLCAFPLVTAADSIDLRGGTRPDALDGIVTGFAEQFRHARFLQNQFVPIDRELAPCFALPILQRFNAIIESRDCHTAFAIMERGKQSCEGSNWICNRTSKNAGM